MLCTNCSYHRTKLHDQRVTPSTSLEKFFWGPGSSKAKIGLVTAWTPILDIPIIIFSGCYVHKILRKKMFFKKSMTKLPALMVPVYVGTGTVPVPVLLLETDFDYFLVGSGNGFS